MEKPESARLYLKMSLLEMRDIFIEFPGVKALSSVHFTVKSEKCRFLLLDEPAAPLSPFETENLFGIVRRLAKEENTAVVFISHRIPEIFDLCERITVMRDGKIAATEEIDEHLTAEKVIEFIPVKKNTGRPGKKRTVPGGVLLECKNLNEAGGRIRNISFALRAGEIAAFAGFVGAGKNELCKTPWDIRGGKDFIEVFLDSVKEAGL